MAWTIGTVGTTGVTGSFCNPPVPAMLGRAFTARRIWIMPAPGGTCPSMEMSGGPRWPMTGLLIIMADGFGKTGMAGLGSATIPGAGRRITMAAGSTMLLMDGAGIPARLGCGIIGRLRWWPSLD